MKKFVCGLMAVGLALTGCGSQSSTKDKADVKIGVIQYMQHDALDASYKGFKDTLVKAGYKASNITIKNASGENSNCETIAESLVNDGNDLIYAIATPAAQAVVKKTKDIPVVVSAVTDPAGSKLVKSNKKPGGNVTGASDLTPVKEQIKLLKQIMPNAKTVAVMYAGNESNSEIQGKMAVKEIKAQGMTPLVKTVSESNEIQSVTDSIVGKAVALYIPTDNLLASNIPAVVKVTDQAKIPVIVGEEGMCTKGGLATYGIDYYNLGSIAGKQAIKILTGKGKPATMPIEYLKASDCKLKVNKAQMEKLGIKVPQEVLDKAELI